MRVTAFIDGFNLYHAVDDTGQHHLKWINLRALCEKFAPSPQFDLTDIFYFSAYATWRPDAYKRHREYVKALKSVGVTPIMGNFKAKGRTCYECGHEWQLHEEKETDVNIALHMVRAAFKNEFDRAILISGDSDMVPAVRMVRAEFPEKQVKIIAPVGRGYSMDLFNAAGGTKNCRKMKPVHLEHSLFGAEVRNRKNELVAVRPAKYAPPPR